MAVEKSESEIVKPPNDKREYRRVVLPNALQVCLISDPDTDKAAASMNVDVGYFCDPEGLEGLAHFLEHMLFYASEKYPIEGSYLIFIAEHGGSTNAFTSSENTNFNFDISADCLEEALDRFAQFFIKPLMPTDAMIREIKAVDSEHQKNLLVDGWRMHQLEKQISSRNHPYHKFSTGSWETLEVRLKAKGLDTRSELLKFYENNYSANLMQLVVYAKENLDVMQSLVESKFESVRNISRNPFDFSGEPCSSEHLQILVKIVPIKDCHKLKISWPITPGIRHYKEGPCGYLSHLIGHEGEGSLFSVLKKLGWAINLEAGEGEQSYIFSFFYTTIELTDAGLEHVDGVVGLVLKYIKLLQDSGVQKWIFDELVAIRETGFHYKDKSPPIHYALDVASKMQLYPPEDWLVGSSLPSKFDPDIIEKILNELTPSNVSRRLTGDDSIICVSCFYCHYPNFLVNRIIFQSKKYEGCTNLTEPWYGTQYAVEKLDILTLEKWMENAPNENLSLPKPNVFIRTDLSLKNVQEKMELSNISIPANHDFISIMPNPILHRIMGLGLVTTRQAVQMSVFSKRWKRLWTSLPFISLCFDEFFNLRKPVLEDEVEEWSVERTAASQRFVKFVNAVLLGREPLKLDVFLLSCAKLCPKYVGHERDWVNYAVRHDTRIMTLSFSGSVPSCTLSSLSVEELDISTFEINFSGAFSLPKLQRLSIREIYFMKNELKSILSGCCALNYLQLEFVSFDESELAHDKIEHLIIEHCQNWEGTTLYVSAPKLLSLWYQMSEPSAPTTVNMPSLIRAHQVISLGAPILQWEEWAAFLSGLICVKTLEIEVLYQLQDVELPELAEFEILEDLTFGAAPCMCCSCLVLTWIVGHAPNLKKLTFKQEIDCRFEDTAIEEESYGLLRTVISQCKSIMLIEIKYRTLNQRMIQLIKTLQDLTIDLKGVKIQVDSCVL